MYVNTFLKQKVRDACFIWCNIHLFICIFCILPCAWSHTNCIYSNLYIREKIIYYKRNIKHHMFRVIELNITIHLHCTRQCISNNCSAILPLLFLLWRLMWNANVCLSGNNPSSDIHHRLNVPNVGASTLIFDTTLFMLKHIFKNTPCVFQSSTHFLKSV